MSRCYQFLRTGLITTPRRHSAAHGHVRPGYIRDRDACVGHTPAEPPFP